MTAPHSRWRLLEEMERLARSHDRAGKALARYPVTDGRPASGFSWWMLPPPLLAIFLGWASADALATITEGAVPFPVASLPGIALAVALTGMTVLTAVTFRDSGEPRAALWSAALAVVCVIGAAVWVALWLEGAAQASRPVAFAAGVLLVLVVTASTFGARLFAVGESSTAGPWNLGRRRAEKAVRSHERTWTVVAHQASVLLGETPGSRAALLRLIDGGSLTAVPDDLDPVHALVLTGLRDHHPRELPKGRAVV